MMMMLLILTFNLVFSLQYICASKPVIVHTEYGNVLGYQTELARVFYGIPFAQPPVGTLRWQPPVPVTKWYPNVINAIQPAPACPQPPNTMTSLFTPAIMSEDCLYLNVFTPIPNNSSPGSPLPVMIFIHGGNFQFADASLPVFESEHLVNTTNVIVALIQYRLGVLGFFVTGNGSGDIKGNYGILDQRLAITWIKANIDAFGGNPNEITLFGQSAGAQSTALHYVTKEMQSFFQRAIIQSAPMTIPFKTYFEYITPSVLLAEQLHCPVGNVTCFRTRSTTEIITAQNAVNNMLTSLNILLYFEPWTPVIDNVIIHGQLLDVIHNLSFPLKPLIIGTVTEEGLDFVYQTWQKPLSSTEYIGIALVIFREHALKVIEQYPPDSSNDQRPLLSRATTQWVFACSTRVFARRAASYSYVFGYPFDTISMTDSLHCSDHACHGDELPFTFESHWDNFTDAGRRVSQSMATYWTNFAKCADPNGPLKVPTYWPLVTTGNEKYMYFQDPLQIEEKYLKNDCDFWDKIGYRNYFVI